MRHGHQVVAHVARVGGLKWFTKVTRDLVAEEIKIYPCIGAAACSTAQGGTVKLPGGIQVVDVESKVKKALHSERYGMGSSG